MGLQETTVKTEVKTVFTGLKGSDLDTADTFFGFHGVKVPGLQSGLMWLQDCCWCPSPQMISVILESCSAHTQPSFSLA